MKTKHDQAQHAAARDEILAKVAGEHFGLETLETRNADGLDFHDVAVWQIREALRAAFEAGRESRRAGRGRG